MQKIVIVYLIILLSGCANSAQKEEAEAQLTADILYAQARSALDSGDYTRAIIEYKTLEARFPFGVYGQQTIFDLAYAHYKNAEPELAISSADRFIELHPLNTNVDYAYYLKGLVNFNQGSSITTRFLPIDKSQRDASSALTSFEDFAVLLKRFPNSRYVVDAKLRMTYLRNILAQHEINVAQYYMRQSAFLAAANRARYVVEHYSRTPAIPDALVLMAKAYKVMELTQLSADTLRVLQFNYPDHPQIQEIKRISLQ